MISSGRHAPRRRRPIRAGMVALALLAGALATALPAAAPAVAGTAAPVSSAATSGDVAPRDARLRLATSDAVLTGTGGALAAAGLLLSPDTREVPAEGFAHREINWGLDRRALGAPNDGARVASEALRLAALLYPAAAAATTRGPHRLVDAEAFMLRDQGEAVLLATGLTLVLKDVASRPRPFTYAAEDARPGADFYDAGKDGAFASFPSGHAATAWASAMTAVGGLASRRPDLSPRAHFVNGLLAGGLATATSLLRVDAQAHFPTDVAAGTAIGAGAGLAVTLLHAGPSPAGAPRGRAWAYGLAGLGAGIALGVLFTPPTSPWIE